MLPDNRGRIVQQHRNVLENPPSKEFRTAPAFSSFLISKLTGYATTLNPNAGLGLQRWSAKRQPVVQTQILVLRRLLCGNSSEKAPYYRGKKALACRGKGGQNTDSAFLALRLRWFSAFQQTRSKFRTTLTTPLKNPHCEKTPSNS